MTQMQLDLSPKTKRRGGRSHHRTTILTTDNATYRRVRELRSGEEMTVEFVNDIVSSGAKDSTNHTPIRRVRLLGKQISGNYRRIKVRSEQGVAISCLLVGRPVGNEDACACRVSVCRDYIA